MQFIRNSRVIDLLFRCELQNQRHQQPLHFHASGGALLQHLFEQNALMGHVLVDDPQPIAARGNDKALVDLPRGRRSDSTDSDVSGAGIASAGNSPCMAASRRESLPEGGGPGVIPAAAR